MAESTTSPKLFSQEMREITRSIHNKSDTMVNLKLGVTMSDDSVWAEGLLVFYEIFKFLEEALERHKDSLIGDLLIPGMARTAAFEADLDHFLGEWRDGYTVRPEVDNYLQHLRKVEDENPYLLIAYIYHLYMGLFSGGQVLRAKRFLSLSSVDKEEVLGNSVTAYDKVSIGSLKKDLKAAINGLTDNLDQETRQAILEEGINVFKMNNTIISSVKGVDEVLQRRLMKLMIAVLLTILFIFVLVYTTAYRETSVSNEDSEQNKINVEL